VIQIPCPYCKNDPHKNKGYYGAIHLEYNWMRCWKCGRKNIRDVIKLLTGQNWRDIYKKYKSAFDPGDLRLEKLRKFESVSDPEEKTLILPGSPQLSDRHKRYLEKRGFDPNHMIRKYSLCGTNHMGEYNYRIIIPIFFKGQIVSFQGRDITGKSELRYKACKKEDEIIHHKHILYGYDQVKNEKHIIVTEGAIDKWKMGDNAVALFGIGYRKEQVLLLTEFEKVTILFDYEERAREAALRLAETLSGLGVDTDVCILKDGDPGELPLSEARELAAEILKKVI
jgi:hypothetical protein